MSLLVVGSIALDTVKTPFGEGREVLGGSATYFSVAASYFADRVCLVGVVGGDFPPKHIQLFLQHNIDIEGLHKEDAGLTFRWKGTSRTEFETAEAGELKEWRRPANRPLSEDAYRWREYKAPL